MWVVLETQGIRSHLTSAKLSLDPVAVSRRSLEMLEQVSHVQAPSGPAPS
jgi:hypothetical protein